MILSNSAWSLQTIDKFLGEQLIPVRLACLTPNGGPIWITSWDFSPRMKHG